MDLLGIFALAISMLSFALALASYLGQRDLQTRMFARHGSEFLAQAVLSLDRLYIDDPTLWSIYDDRADQDRNLGRLKALGLYYLNMFQMAYDLYCETAFRKDGRSTKLLASWDAWLRTFLGSSSVARSVWHDNRNSYDEGFRKHVDKILEEAAVWNREASEAEI
jgi:hypothetical protein